MAHTQRRPRQLDVQVLRARLVRGDEGQVDVGLHLARELHLGGLGRLPQALHRELVVRQVDALRLLLRKIWMSPLSGSLLRSGSENRHTILCSRLSREMFLPRPSRTRRPTFDLSSGKVGRVRSHVAPIPKDAADVGHSRLKFFHIWAELVQFGPKSNKVGRVRPSFCRCQPNLRRARPIETEIGQTLTRAGRISVEVEKAWV